MPELFDESPGDMSPWSLPGDPKPPERDGPQPEPPSLEESSRTAEPAEDNAATEERPRDEHGRFLPKEDAQAQAEVESEPELILGKFRTAEDVIRAYQELEQHAGGLRNEVGELRSLVEDRFTQLQNQPPQPQFDLDEMIDANPAQATELAWRSGNEAALRKALASWDELAPGMAAVWVEGKQMAAKLAELEQQQQPILQQTEEQHRLTVVAQAAASLEQQYPDFEQQREAMGKIAAELSTRNGESYVDTLLRKGTQASVSEALEYLYLKARDRQGDNLAEVSQQLAREHAQNTSRAVNDAIVASATTTSGEAPQPSVAEKIKASWDKVEAPYTRDESGWNI